MEAIFLYILKFSGLISLFFLSYYFLLRKETFFNSNRWFLLAGLFTALILPLLVYTKIVWVAPSPIPLDFNLPVNEINQAIQPTFLESYFYPTLIALYCLTTLTFIGKFIFDFISLKKIIKGETIQKQSDFKFIDVSQNIAPFSFFNLIVYNSSLYNGVELENIIEHEKVHSEQNHTVDVLISRLFCILFWFNPIVWFYKKAIIQNLEFIADKEASLKIADKKAYQYTLLKITTHENCVAITNHFYQSLIKKRIVMLNKNQSKKQNYFKYAVVIPALVAFVLLFQFQTIAQEKEVNDEISTIISSNNLSSFKLIVDSNSSDEKLAKYVDLNKTELNIDLKFSGIKRNSAGEIIAIKVTMKLDGQSEKAYQVKSNTPIKKFAIFYESENNIVLNYGFNTVDEIKTQPYTSISTSTKTDTLTAGDKKTIVISANTKSNINNNTNEKIVLHDKSKAKPLYIIDGKEINDDTKIKELDPNSIASINVYKDENAIKLYGENGKNGVIVIKSKETNTKSNYTISTSGDNLPKEQKSSSGWAVSYKTSSQNETINHIINQNNIDYKKAVIVINGKLSDYESLENFNPMKVTSTSVTKVENLPEKTKSEMIAKYGEKVLNGYIEISSKPHTEEK